MMSRRSSIPRIFLIEMLLVSICFSSPTDSKLSSLETELESTKHIVHEMLGSVNKLSKQSLVSKTELQNLKANIELQADKIDDISRRQQTEGGENMERRFQTMFETIRDSKDSVNAVLEEAMRSVDKKIEDLQEEIVDKLEKKVKRQGRGKFVSEETFDLVARQVEELNKLPESLNASVAQTYTAITANLNRMTITREEFAAFQLSVARDTCKTRFNEGLWVMIQQRGPHGNPENYFARPLAEYVRGFGDPNKEFWLGLDKLRQLTAAGAKLRIELETFEGQTIFASYSSFRVEGEDFRIQVGGYEGTAGDPMRIDNGMAFSTMDQDKDQWTGDCSKTRGSGGWWFNGCGLANLNGINFGENVNSYDGILWYFYARDNRSFKSARMMISKI